MVMKYSRHVAAIQDELQANQYTDTAAVAAGQAKGVLSRGHLNSHSGAALNLKLFREI